MKPIPVDSAREHDSLWSRVKGPAGPRTSGKRHYVRVLASQVDYPTADDALEKSFQELVHCYRHSSIGSRCLGIVHQMNTPLQVLSFQLDLLEQKAQEELDLLSGSSLGGVDKLAVLTHYRQGKLRQLRGELDKLRHFTRSLMVQGVQEEAQEKLRLDLNQLYGQELEHYLTLPFFKHQVIKEIHFQDGLPPVYGYHIDFSQSFRNLIDNALEAMAEVESPRLTVATAYRDGRLMLRIGDNGVGIPSVNLPLIFDAFFTTKKTPVGNRAGLGLFLVRRLLAPYQAEIVVDSTPGETWITVSLPAG